MCDTGLPTSLSRSSRSADGDWWCASTLFIQLRFKRCYTMGRLLPLLAIVSPILNILLLLKHWEPVSASHVVALSTMQPVVVTNNETSIGNTTGVFQQLANTSQQHPAPSVSACLLAKDDNDILHEWIAYHYHTLGMRHVILAVDPDSRDVPNLDRWKGWVNVTIWTDHDYMPKEFRRGTRDVPKKFRQEASKFPHLTEDGHRYRQRVFLARCMRTFKKQKQSWLLHIDTDEYVVPSKAFRSQHSISLSNPGATLQVLQNMAHPSPCISMRRLLFGSIESSLEDQQLGIPEAFNATSLESVRWRYHAPPHNTTLHGNPKVLLNLAALHLNELPHDLVFSIHRPLRQYCPPANNELETTWLTTHHYLGSYERYSAKGDNRRTKDIYERKANLTSGKPDDGTRLWLRGFVDSVGSASAETLLQEHVVVVRKDGSMLQDS